MRTSTLPLTLAGNNTIMTPCRLQTIGETNRDSGEEYYISKDPKALHLGIGLSEESLEKLAKMNDKFATENSVYSKFKEALTYWALSTADKTAAISATILPQTMREAIARKLMEGMLLNPGVLEHGMTAKSWVVRKLYLQMTRIPGGTAGAFAEGVELNAAAVTHRIRMQLTGDWQGGFKSEMMKVIKAQGLLNLWKVTGIHDNTGYAKEVWKELILHTNQMDLGRTVTWSQPELEGVANHLHKTYGLMEETLLKGGVNVSGSHRAPIRFGPNLGEILDQMGPSAVKEAIKRAGNPDVEKAYGTLMYSTKQKGMTVVSSPIEGLIDLAYENNGAALIDAVDLNGWAGVGRDINKVAATVAMRQTSKGLIASDKHWEMALKVAGEELLGNGVSPAKATKALQLLQDTYDSLSGNPLRGGVAPEIQMLRTAAVNTMLGTAGYANLAVVTLGFASKLAAVMTNRGGLELAHLLKNTFRMTPLAKELEAFIPQLKGNHNFMPVQVMEELADSFKYSWLRQVEQSVLKILTLNDLQGSISRVLMTVNGMNLVSRYAAKFISTQTLNDVARYYRRVPTSMEHKRGVTGGFWEPNGPNPYLEAIFNKVSYTAEGNIANMNEHLMTEVEKSYLSSLLINEMQRITGEGKVAGEFPAWLNPLVSHTLMQFKDIGIKLSSSNAMAGIRYGDADAVFEHLMAAGMSSMLVYGRETASDLVSGAQQDTRPLTYGDIAKFGFRMNEIGAPINDAFHIWGLISGAPENRHLGEALWSEAPIGSLTYGLWDGVAGETMEERVTGLSRLAPFRNVALANLWVDNFISPAYLTDLADFKRHTEASTHRTAGIRE